MTTWVARDKSFVDGPELPEIWYNQKTSTEKQLDFAETSLYLHLEDKSLSFKQKSKFDSFFSYQIELGGPSRGNLHARISIERCVGVKRKRRKGKWRNKKRTIDKWRGRDREPGDRQGTTNGEPRRGDYTLCTRRPCHTDKKLSPLYLKKQNSLHWKI